MENEFDFNAVKKRIIELPVDHQEKWDRLLAAVAGAFIIAFRRNDTDALLTIKQQLTTINECVSTLLNDPHVKIPAWEDE